jgi:3-deoxy-manno-octulosonate cytidylyltransferase (CMP-KDO synthetase)
MAARLEQPSAPPRAVALVPARLASTRLPRKLLLAESGAPLLVHTLRNARASAAFELVAAACDAPELVEVARAAGFEALETSPSHPSGSDRIREAWELLAARGARADVLVGLQGDEPEIPHEPLRALVAAFADPSVEAATLCCALVDEAEALEPSVVKVVRDARGDALYFSRAPIPSRGHGEGAAPRRLRHVGVYAWRPTALSRFVALPRGALEQAENLEQLRWLEHGGRMRVVECARFERGIDLREDYDAFLRRRAARVDEGLDMAKAEGGAG